MEFILIAICFAFGLFSVKLKILKSDDYKSINYIIIYLILPAVTLKYLPHIKWDRNIFFPIISPLFLWFFSYFVVKIISFFFNLSKKNFGAIWLAIGLSNTSFLGFPLTKTYFGEQGLEVAILCDQISFIIVSVLGVWVAIKYSESENSIKKSNSFFNIKILLKVLTFPSFIAFVISILFSEMIKNIEINQILSPLNSCLIPLAFFSIGMQMSKNIFHKKYIILIILLLTYKLIISPGIVYSAGRYLELPFLVFSVTVFEVAMAPMVTAVIISNQYNLNPRLSNSLLGFGIIFSFPTSYIWVLFLK